jgi:peptidoglycan DL-endopeptidase CwlO
MRAMRLLPVNRFLRCFVIGLIWATTAIQGVQAQDTAGNNSDDKSTPKAHTPRKKKAKPPSDDDTPSTPAPSGKSDPDNTNPPSAAKKKKAAVAEDDAPVTPPPTEKTVHAPAATLEADRLTDFSAQPASVQQLIKAALDLTKLNLTYTYGSAEPSAGGMDCSGTIYYLLRTQGLKDVPRDSSEQYSWARRHGQFFAVMSTEADGFEFADLQPGDLMFWSGTYKTERTVPITHVMLYLGHEKGTGKRVMFGSSDGRSYHGVQRWGVSVFDFTMPKSDPANPEKHAKFVGYAHIPALRESAPVVAKVTAIPSTPTPKQTPAPATPPPATPSPVKPQSATPPPATPPPATPPPATPSASTPSPVKSPSDLPHEPARGTAERKAIMDALRAGLFAAQAKSVIFQVNYLRVHDGWAWTDVTPQSHSGLPKGTRSTALLHLEDGKWNAVPPEKLPPGSGSGLGEKEAARNFVKSLLEAMPNVPADIFPKHTD